MFNDNLKQSDKVKFFRISTRNNRKVFYAGKLKCAIKLRPSVLKIIFYRLYKKTRHTNVVCYTCLCGDYDNLENLYNINFNWDYICFTDNQELLKQKFCGIWETRPLVYNKGSNAINNRYHKFFPYKVLPEYSDSIYIDSNINVLTSKLSRIFKQRKSDFLLPRHFCNECIYEELDKIVTDQKDTAEHMAVLRKKYETEKMPHHLGFAENNVLYRNHKATWLYPIMEQWWEMLLNYSKRDQASFVYVLWKNGYDINAFTFDNCRNDYKNFCITDHKGKK